MQTFSGVIIMKDYFFALDDGLDRKPYGEFLEKILFTNERNRRDDNEGAYVLAVDSPWGTGKTRFAMMLKNHLERRIPPDGKQDLHAKIDFNAIYYDALRSDYNSDAMEPLMHSILSSDKFSYDGATSDVEKLEVTCKGILKAIGYGVFRNVVGDVATEIIRDMEGTLEEIDIDPLESYKKKLELYENFRDNLGLAIARSKKKLVIIVDELDRCKPTFAIQTIEMAKHLFDVKGLIFVFFLDISQLSSAVKCIYGNDMDATGYLCRYFDFISRLPTPDTLHFIETKLKTNQFCKCMASEYEETKNYILKLSQTFQLSLRDISTILTNYAIMCSTVLQNYTRFDQHRIYLFLLVMKYKNLELYNTIISDSHLREEQEKLLTNQGHLKKHTIEYQSLLHMLKRIPLRDMSLPFVFAGKIDRSDPAKIINAKNVKNGIEITYLSGIGGKERSNAITLKENDNWGNILFYWDLRKWQKIKDITLAEHYSRQLDQFQFAGIFASVTASKTEDEPDARSSASPESE